MRTIIATVGTSLLTNPDRDINDDKKRPWAGWKQGSELPKLEIMLKYLQNADMQRASAETNTFQALLQEEDKIILLHTQTEDGRICAEAIKEYYKKQNYLVETREIIHLNYLEKSFAENGLKSLVSILLDEINKARNERRIPILCATGGFKAEVAFLSLTGILLGIDVYYIYEKFEKLIQFPSFPITWNTDIVRDNLSFFEWIDEEPRKSQEVENRLHQCPQLRVLTTGDQNGYIYLSAIGDLLYKAYKQIGSVPRAIWPESSKRSPQEKKGLSNIPHNRPRNWEEIVDELSRIDCVEYIRYDGSAPSNTRNAGVYKTDSQKGEIYAAYKNDDRILPMIISTTARGDEQCKLVVDHIDKIVKRN